MASTTGRTWVLPKRGDGTLWLADVFPTLSTPQISAITTTSARISATPSRIGGSVYFVITHNPGLPSAAQVKGGFDITGAQALESGSQDVLTPGPVSFAVTALTGLQLKYAYLVFSAAGYDSAVVAATAFTLTAIAPTWSTPPNQSLLRSGSFPKILANMRQYVSDPSSQVDSIALVSDNAAVTYNAALDRIEITDPGINFIATLQMRAVVDGVNIDSSPFTLTLEYPYPSRLAWPVDSRSPNILQALLDANPTFDTQYGRFAGDTYSQNGDMNPPNVATLTYDDYGVPHITFVDFPIAGGPGQPVYFGKVRAAGNTSSLLSVPVGTLTGLAAGQGLVMVVTSVQPLTTSPASQGWTLAGKYEPGGIAVQFYVFKKIAGATEASVNIQHAGGRICAVVSNWNNVDPVIIDAFDQNTQITVSGGSAFTTPSITPSVDNCAIVSVAANASSPVFSAQPAGYSLIDQFIVSTVFWQGDAYKLQTTKAATGVLTWTLTDAGANKIGCTFAIRGKSSQGTARYSFTCPFKLHSDHYVGEDGQGNIFFAPTFDPYESTA